MQVFLLITLNIQCYSLLACRISAEKSAYGSYLVCNLLFFLATFNMFFFFKNEKICGGFILIFGKTNTVM